MSSATQRQQQQQLQLQDVENGLYPQLHHNNRPQTTRQDTVDMEEIPLREMSQPESEDRRKIRSIFDRVGHNILSEIFFCFL